MFIDGQENAPLSRVDINSNNNAEILNVKKSGNRMHFLAACLALTCPVFVKAGCQARPLQLYIFVVLFFIVAK